MSQFEDKCNGRRLKNEDTFESLIGATYLDFNETEIENYDFYEFHVCEKFLINLIEAKDFTDLIKNDYNLKINF